MFLLKAILFSIAITQILATENTSKTATELINNFNQFTQTAQTNLDTKLDTIIAEIEDTYKKNPDPYNDIVDLINTFISTIYKDLKTYVASVGALVSGTVLLVKNEESSFVNLDKDAIFANINIGTTEIKAALKKFAYNVTSALLAEFQKLIAALKEANYGRGLVNIAPILSKAQTTGDDVFNKGEVPIVGNKTQGLTFIDDNIAALKTVLPKKECKLLDCIFSAVGDLLNDLFK